MSAISLSQLSKGFGWGARRLQALDSVSFEVPDAGVYGLLGLNGAGKSTLLRMICGLILPDKGGIRLFGEAANPHTRKKLGALIDSPTFYPFMTARQFLFLLTDTSGVRADIESVLKRVDLVGA